MLNDLRYALRALRRMPGFTLTAVACLALGIGANTTVYSVVNALQIRPLPLHEPHRLVAVTGAQAAQGHQDSEVSLPLVEDVRARSRTLAATAAMTSRFVSMLAGDRADGLEAAEVTSAWFDVLGLPPLLGRGFREADGAPGAPPTVVLGEALWRARFAADPDILGRPIVLDGQPREVVGVMPARVAFTGAREQLWLPLTRPVGQEGRGNRSYEGIARLAPGVTMAQADAELRAMGREFAERHPTDRGWTLYVTPVRQALLSRSAAGAAAVMMGAVSFVLLIACANVANLLLARGASRTRELAVRTTLGAGRARIVRQLLGESLVLSLAGGALGLLLARGGVAWMTRQSTHMASWIVFDIDWRVLAFAATVSVATALVVGLLPALRVSGVALAPVLRDGGRGASAGAGGRRLRDGLVVAELALSLVLLAGAGLMVKSVLRLQRADPGFDPAGLTVAQLYTGGARYDASLARTRFAAAVLERVRALPGVTDAAFTNAAPLDGSSTSSGYVVEGQPAAPGEELSTEWRGVTAEYRRTMGIPLVAGRDFTAAEAHDTATRLLVVNDRLAARAWPGESALGRRVSFAGGEPGSWYTVIGVVGTVQQRMNRSRTIGAQIYFAHADAARRGSSLIVRGGDPATLPALLRAAVRSVDAGVPVVEARPYAAIVERSLMEQRLFGVLFGIFAVVALALAVIGVYGVIAYTVAMRTREIGVRMALGAGIRDVYALVLRQGGGLVAAGLGIGFVAAVGLTRLLRSTLHGVSATDPAVFTGVVLALAGSALLATWIPARRAARVDPAITLRGD